MPTGLSSRPRLRRWLVPPGVAAIMLGVFGLVPRLAAAEGQPSLPPLTAQQLVDKVQASHVEVFSGTIRLSSHLGLPSLGALQPTVLDTASMVLAMLSGSHTASIWVAGPDHFRLALPSGLAETDLIRNGSDLWQWQSDGMIVQHRTIQAKTRSAAAYPEAPTPPGAAESILNNLDPSTRISVRNTAYVAGRPVYELVLAPRPDQSTIADVVIAVDAGTGLPLRLQILARDQNSPSLELGFTSISFSRPAASTFAFTPPPGSRVNQPDFPAGGRRLRRFGGRVAAAKDLDLVPIPVTPGPMRTQVVGANWDQVLVISGANLAFRGADLLDRAATPVAGSWGSGRLLTTSLVNVLLENDGRILAGAVTPQALESVAGQQPAAASAG